MTNPRDPHRGPVPDAAWAADAESRRTTGRVQVFNAVKADGLDGWTMDERQWALVREHILGMIDEYGGPDGSVPLQLVVDTAKDRYSASELFPKGRVTNYVRFTKVDLEARCEVERLPGTSPQRIRRWRDDPS